MDKPRRMSVIGSRRSTTSVPNISPNISINKYELEIENLKNKLKEQEKLYKNLKEEYSFSKREYENIIEGLVSDINAKSNEINEYRNNIEENKTLAKTISIRNLSDQKLSDQLDGYKENLKYTRTKNKALTQRNNTLERELLSLREKLKESYLERKPIIAPLTDNTIKLSQFIISNEIKPKQDNSEELQEITEKEKENETDNVIDKPILSSKDEEQIINDSIIDSLDSSSKNTIQVIVTLPRNDGVSSFFFPVNITVDSAKKYIFRKKLPHLRSNMFMFGLSETEFLEVEFVKFLDAHDSFYDLFSLGQPIKVILLDKTVSRFLGDMNMLSRNKVPTETDEECIKELKHVRRSKTASLIKFNKKKLKDNKRDSNIDNNAKDIIDITNNDKNDKKEEIEKNKEDNKEDNNTISSNDISIIKKSFDKSLLSRKISISSSIFEDMKSEQSTLIYNSHDNSQPKQISKTDCEDNKFQLLKKLNNNNTLPYDKLDPNHYPICILTSSGIPFIIFIPNDSNEEALRKLLTTELRDTIERLRGNQKIFFYGDNDDFIPLEKDILIIDHPNVSEFRNEHKIPITSIGESCIFNNYKDIDYSPLLELEESIEKKFIDDDIKKESALLVYDIKSDIDITNNNNNLLKTITPINKERKGAIKVKFCYEDHTLTLRFPRKADTVTMKKMVLQRLGLNDSTAAASKLTLKITGTSYFIVEGETQLEDLPIVQFCQKKGLTPMLSLVTKEQSREDKLISKKLGLILSDGKGAAILNWRMKDTDATDFRIKMSRIVGDQPFQYIPGVFTEDSGPIDFKLPDSFKVCIHLGEEGGSGLQDCSTVLQVIPSSIASDIIERACKKFRFAANFVLLPHEYYLKICGFEKFLKSSSKLESISYIRECIQKKKQISFALVPKLRVPTLNSKNIYEQNALLIDTPFDTATVDSYGDSETVSLLELKSHFEFKIHSIDHLDAIGKKEKESEVYYIEAGIYHGGLLVGELMISHSVSLQKGTVKWRKWLRSSIKLCQVPEDSRVCITLWLKKETSGVQAIANVNVSLFDFKDHFRTGNVSLKMWTDGEANPIGTCMENLRAKEGSVPIINLSFHSFPMNIAFPQLQPLIQYGDNYYRPVNSEKVQLLRIVDSDPLRHLTNDEQVLVWKSRDWLRNNAKAKSLIKILQCVKWYNVQQVRDIYRLLSLWDPVDPVDALQLLDAQFSNRKVREYAVRCLDKLQDDEIKDYLLQLVQTLKYESNHFSPLAVWLLNRALRNQILIGHYFFWHLKSELHVPEIAERYALLLEMYLRGCGTQRDDLLKQVQLINQLNDVAQAIKTVPSSKRRADLQKRLSELDLPDEFQLPLDPLRKANGLVIEKCKSMDSAKAPLWLVFKNADPLGDDIWLIFKSGDDLRQDSLTLQMLGIMDKIWMSEGLDLCLTPYKCIATGDEMGMIETVLDSDTTANIQKAAGGVTGALKQTPLANWIKNHNPDGYDQAVENFTRSCAGYCVATYVLGIGDRHNDNIMVNKHGFLFHIDFGHFLGHYKKVLYVRRERAPFVLTPEFANVMGCKGSDTFNKFINLCIQGYNILRRHANVFINLFAMMLSTGIPELQSETDIEYLRQALVMDLNDEEAGIHFTKLIKESLESMSTQLMFVTHIIAHPK